MLSPSSRYREVFLSITVNVESAGTAIVEAIAIGDPPDLVINTDASTDDEPSILATRMVLILKTFPDDDALARISVVSVVSNACCFDFAVIVATFTRFGAAIIYSPCDPFIRKLMPLQ